MNFQQFSERFMLIMSLGLKLQTAGLCPAHANWVTRTNK